MHLHVLTHTHRCGDIFLFQKFTRFTLTIPKVQLLSAGIKEKNSSNKWNYSWFVAWGRKCFTKAIFSKAVGKHCCKHNDYSCPCWGCVKQTQAGEAGSVRKEREISREMANQGGKSKDVGICHGLALLSGRCTAEAMAKGQEFGTGEVAALLLKFTGCYLQKAQSKTWS